ncbi:hypothetical protein BYT27DRAFT_7189527 [Phlegmacium glaucopus]|nr:hypothetical protein BYT27DRAFT_7189527 [Phlegmacium glaucopus]
MHSFSYRFSTPSLPGAWSSEWSLPQYEMESEVAAINRVGDDHDPPTPSNSVDLDCPEPPNTAPPSNHMSISRSETDAPGALLASSDSQSLESQSTLASSQDNAIPDCNSFPGEYPAPYSCPSFCSSHESPPLAFERNLSLETLSLRQPSVSDYPMDSPSSTLSRKFSFASEPGDIDQETIHSCSSLRKPTEIARPSFDNHTLLGNFDTFLDKTNFLEQVPGDSHTGRNYSSELYPHPLLLSQPDGNNTWTLSLDPTISRPETISESSLELDSLSLLSSCASDHDDEAIARIRDTLPSAHSTPGYDGSFVSLPPLQVGGPEMAEFSTSSDVSMIVSSTSSVQQQHGEGTEIPSRRNADLYYNDLSYDFPLSVGALDPQQLSPSKPVKKSKGIFGRLKRLFTPKGTILEDTQAHTAHPKSLAAKNLSKPVDSNAQADTMPLPSGRRFLLSLPSWSPYQRNRVPRSTKSAVPSIGQSFNVEDTSHADNNIDEKYTYEYHARPKTLKEIKSQRRFSLPMAFGGNPSRATSSTKRNITTSVPRSQSRPMSMYIAS